MCNLFFDAINAILNFSFNIMKNNNKLRELNDEIQERKSSKFVSEEDNKMTNLMENMLDNALIDEVKIEILKLSETNYKKFSNLISLLALEYYNLVFYDILTNKDFKKLDDNNVVIRDMINKSKKEFISDIQMNINNNLDTMLLYFFDEYNYEKVLIEYDYNYVIPHIDSLLTRFLYEKFHPNYKEEIYEANKYKLNCDIETMRITNVLEFIHMALMCKANVEDSCDFAQILQEKMWIIAEENENLYNELILYLTKYFYIEYINGKFDRELIPTEKDIIEFVENGKINDILKLEPDYELLKAFYNFDIMEYIEMSQKIDSSKKEKIKKLNIEY